MKKLGAILLTVALVVGLSIPMAIPAAAHTESEPQVQTLYAGQTIDVGDVEVWNDGDNLYVTYVITDLDWVITGTHLYVGKTNPDTLTTAPGQFPYNDDDAAVITDTMVSYVIPLTSIYDYEMELNKKGKETGKMVAVGDPGVTPCTDVYIAAHAVVEKTTVISGTVTPELTWTRSSEEDVANFAGYGAQWDPVTDGFTIMLDAGELVWDGGTGSQNFTGYSSRSDVSWASWDYAATDPRGGDYNGTSDLRRFNATFTLSAEVAASITSATLKMPDYVTADVIPINDNVYIFLNGELAFWGGTRDHEAAGDLTTFQGMDGTPGIWISDPGLQGVLDITDGWYIPGTFPNLDVADFTSGTNALDVFTEENQVGGGMAELALELAYEYEEVQTETAWADDIDFTHPNWAMYFEYHVQGGIGEAGDGWTDVATDYEWEARARHGGAGGWRAFVDDVFPPVNPLWTGPTVPWLNGGQMWFELIYDDPTNSATFTIYRSSDDFVLGTVSDSTIPGFDGLIGIQGKTSPEAAGSVVVDNVKVNGIGLFGDDGFTAQGTDFVRDLKYLEISAVPPGSFTLTGDLTFTWVVPKDEGPCLSIYVQN
jgi:hypothetical protein